MSENDGVCAAVVSALNKAEAGSLQLYRDPLFLPWRILRSSHNLKPFSQWGPLDNEFAPKAMIVDLLNDGVPRLLLKLVNAPGGRPEYDEVLAYEGPEVVTREWDSEDDIVANWRGRGTVGAVEITSEGSPTGYPKLPSDMRTHPPWRDYDRLRYPEINIISVDGKIYAVWRETVGDIGVVVKFDHDRKWNDVCYIEPEQQTS
jgi:hypothetical protein